MAEGVGFEPIDSHRIFIVSRDFSPKHTDFIRSPIGVSGSSFYSLIANPTHKETTGGNT